MTPARFGLIKTVAGDREAFMRPLYLWLLGVPIPVFLLLYLFQVI